MNSSLSLSVEASSSVGGVRQLRWVFAALGRVDAEEESESVESSRRAGA